MFDFIEGLGYSKNKTYNVLQKFRSKSAHGGATNFDYFNSDIHMIQNAAKALLILFFNHYLSLKKVGPFNDDLVSHNVWGDIPKYKADIEVFANSNISKRI